MSQIVETKGRKWIGNKFIWMVLTVTAVSALLYWEQTAVLYVISTVMLTGLLLVVAFSDLESKDRELRQPAETEAAAVIESAHGAQSQAVTQSHSISKLTGSAEENPFV